MLTVCCLTAGVSAAQPDNGACAGYQASTQPHPVVIEARSAEMTTGEAPAVDQVAQRSGATFDEHHASGAAGSGSGADAVRSRLTRLFGQDFHLSIGCLASQAPGIEEYLCRRLRWRCQRCQCHCWCTDRHEVDESRQVLIVQGDQRTPGFARYRRIDRICAAQAMLGSQGEGVESTHLVQHSDGHMRQPTQRGGKRLCLRWRTACSTDRSGDFDQHQIRHNDWQCLAPQHLKELATD